MNGYEWPDGAPSPSEAYYELFRMRGDEIYPRLVDKPITEDEVAARFRQKWGLEPEYIIPCGRYLRVGPAPIRR